MSPSTQTGRYRLLLVVGLATRYLHGTVQLFQQDDTGKVVRQGDATERQGLVCACAYRVAYAVRPADDERQVTDAL